MDFNQLSSNFNDIENSNTKINNILDRIKQKIVDLDKKYLAYSNNKNNLKSLNFQIKLIKIEYKNNQEIFQIFMNRLYGDYYKLYQDMNNYIRNYIKEIDVKSIEYQCYKDLEILVIYDFEVIKSIHDEIIIFFHSFLSYQENDKNIIDELLKTRKDGVHINNFINDKNFIFVQKEQKFNLYYENLRGYLQIKKKFLERIYIKFKKIYTELSLDINLDISNRSDSINLDEYGEYSGSEDSVTVPESIVIPVSPVIPGSPIIPGSPVNVPPITVPIVISKKIYLVGLIGLTCLMYYYNYYFYKKEEALPNYFYCFY